MDNITIGKAVLTVSDRKATLKYKLQSEEYSFVLRFLTSSELVEIERKVGQDFVGASGHSLITNAAVLSRAIHTIDTAIEESPDWWKDFDSAGDYPDPEFIRTMYDDYMAEYERFLRRIRGSVSRTKKAASKK